jgi:hypothetical protein
MDPNDRIITDPDAYGWCIPRPVEPVGWNGPAVELPAVSVRRGGIRWPKRWHFVLEGGRIWERWCVMINSPEGEWIEARFYRRRTAEHVAKLLNEAERREPGDLGG